MIRHRTVWGCLFLLAVLSGWVSPAHAQQTISFFLQPVGDNGEAITNARCRILTTTTATTQPTIYTDGTLATTKTNPITVDATSGVCLWYMDGGTTTVDAVIYVDDGPYKGARARIDSVTRTTPHKVLLNRSSSVKVLAVPFTATPSTTPVNTTFTLPGGSQVINATVETTTLPAAPGSTIDVLTTEPASTRFCAGVATNVLGFASCGASAVLQTDLRTIQYHNQSHASAGFVYVYYLESGGQK